MKLEGPQSWRFEESVDQLPHVVLYVRDALGLETGGNPNIPPRLTGTIEDRSHLLDETLRRQASVEWVQWWEAILGPVEPLAGLPEQLSVHSRQTAARVVRFFDPPDWHSLDDRPALRQGLAAVFRDADGYADDARHRIIRPHRPPSLLPYPLVRHAAESVAADQRVPVGLLSASASMIFVDRPCWRLVGRGELLCSAETASVPDLAFAALVAVFMSLL